MKQVVNPIIKRLQLVFGISIVLLLISSYASYYSIGKLVDRSKWVNHTFIVINTNKDLMMHMQRAESVQRAFLLTHDKSYLDLFKVSIDSAHNDLAQLWSLTSDNGVQQHNIDTFKKIMERRINHLVTLSEQERAGTTTQETRAESIIIGTQLMKQLRDQSKVINDSEEDLLSSRSADQAKFSTYTPILILIASFISILITASSYFRIKADLDARIAQQEEEQRKFRETRERITKIESVTRLIASGDYTVRSDDHADDDLGRISHALNEMIWSLQKNFREISDRSWLQSGSVEVSDAMRGQNDVSGLADSLMQSLAAYLGAHTGVAYVANDTYTAYELQGRYAAASAQYTISQHDGLAGQAIKDGETKVLHDMPAGYLTISSALGSITPSYLLIVPLSYGDRVTGLIEFGFLQRPSDLIIALMEAIKESIAIAINAALTFRKTQELLERTQAQSEELQAQHSELENMNTELEAQTQKLQASEEELKVQQEELLQTNQELEERSKLLEEKSQLIFERNVEIQKKAEELALSTKYKSEFLANMSHELRTPLNSILLLSRLMAENTEKNLTGEQVEYAQVIQGSGGSLLNLIDEILDLSKIESGKMTIEFLPVGIEDIISDVRPLFVPLAREKGISFDVVKEDHVPALIETDQIRIEQVLKNLLSNAMKFTTTGGITLTVRPSRKAVNSVEFSVKDTGIGIPRDKQELIFEAFQQADGSTRRKFGGTGLGLSISRELTKLLGGTISVSSEPDKGSEFTITVPIRRKEQQPEEDTAVKIEIPSTRPTHSEPVRKTYIADHIPAPVPDDREDIHEGDKMILIIEDDTHFAQALLTYARRNGYKGLVAVQGDEGIRLAETFMPVGVLLDIQLPVKDGWQVMEELKGNPATRHIPVHMMSSMHMRKESLMHGAIDFIDKPVAFEQMPDIFRRLEHVVKKKDKKVLIIEENDKHAQALSYYLQSYDVKSEIKSSVADSVAALKSDGVDCVILDMGVPDHHAYAMLEAVKKNPGLEDLPIIVFTGKSLSKSEEQKIKAYADSIVVKTAHSYQRILDEVSIFLHLIESTRKQQQATSKYKNPGALSEVLRNKKIMIVDDDIRNIYSLTHALEQYKVNVVTATDGKEALATLAQNPDTNIVLMDIMMPEMDGYEAIRNIRSDRKNASLPVIAVTAKAMIGDREKCMQAGASDYISKPIDLDQLLSLLRVWLYEQ